MARHPVPSLDLRLWLSGEVDLAEMFWRAVELVEALAGREGVRSVGEPSLRRDYLSNL